MPYAFRRFLGVFFYNLNMSIKDLLAANPVDTLTNTTAGVALSIFYAILSVIQPIHNTLFTLVDILLGPAESDIVYIPIALTRRKISCKVSKLIYYGPQQVFQMNSLIGYVF